MQRPKKEKENTMPQKCHVDPDVELVASVTRTHPSVSRTQASGAMGQTALISVFLDQAINQDEPSVSYGGLDLQACPVNDLRRILGSVGKFKSSYHTQPPKLLWT